MASENGKSQEEQSEELYAWIATIPFSKPKKNLTRDFSDAVLMAEVLKVYYPRYVDLHNYVPASSLSTKKENWNILNRKVLTKIDMKLTKDTIHELANSHPGAAEQLLLELKNKILKDSAEPQDPSCETKNRELNEQGKNDERNEETADEANLAATSRRVDELTLQALDSDISTFVRAKQRIFFTVKWLISWLCVWNYFPSFRKLRPLKNLRKERTDMPGEEIRSVNIDEEDSVPRNVCTQLRQELREKDDIISTLNHKVAYLESAMKLRDLRISNLTSQILQNAVETEQFAKTQINSSVQLKSRPRSQNVREKIKLEE